MTTTQTPQSEAPVVAVAPGADALALVPGSSSEARIAHLFRAARRQGRIHPLQHLIQRHRADAQAAADAGAADAATATGTGTAVPAARAPSKPATGVAP